MLSCKRVFLFCFVFVFLHILDTSLLSDIWFANIFSYSVGCLFVFLMYLCFYVMLFGEHFTPFSIIKRSALSYRFLSELNSALIFRSWPWFSFDLHVPVHLCLFLKCIPLFSACLFWAYGQHSAKVTSFLPPLCPHIMPLPRPRLPGVATAVTRLRA